MSFGEQIRYVRKQLKLNQTEFGKLLNVNFTTVNRWENGKNQPSYQFVVAFQRLCDENNITFSEKEQSV